MNHIMKATLLIIVLIIEAAIIIGLFYCIYKKEGK